jgi:hypothetical protein
VSRATRPSIRLLENDDMIATPEGEGQRCVVCGQFTRIGLLCPIHLEQGEQYSHHLRRVAKHEMIAVTRLDIADYQRPLNDDKVQSIVLNFNEWDLGELCVSRRTQERIHTNYLIDGQHRWAALMRMGFAEAPCEVLEGLSYEQEVMIFVVRNRDRSAVRKGTIFRDQAKAGQKFYAEATAILHTFGYEIVDPGWGGGKIRVSTNHLSCPGAVEKVHAMGRLAGTLQVMRAAWPQDPQANRAEVLLGMAAFLTMHPQIGHKELAETLAKWPASEIVNQAKAVSKTSTERRLWVHLFNALVERWNYGRARRLPRMDVPRGAPGIWMR